MKNLKVSIIVPVYNVEKSLDKCLRSLSRQTLKDIEIICINDGSKDKSVEILELWADVEKRIKIIHQNNAGLSAARNAGMKKANGEYICFVDSDDWVDEDFCEKLYNAAIKHNADISCATIIRKRNNSEKYRVHYTEEKIYTTLEEKIKCCDIPRCCYVWNKLYKRELIQNKLFKVATYFEDILWIPDVLKASNKLVTVPDTNYYYCVNSKSIVKTNNRKKQTDNYNSKLNLINFFDENGLELSKKQRILTKKIYYICKLPILKIQEYQEKERWLLFGIIPFFNFGKLFFFTDFDSHYIFRLGKIKLNIRHKANIKYKEVNELGVTTEKRNPQIIVSLTSYPARISTIHIVISSLLQQTVKPDKIILWLAESQFPQKEQDLPENLLRLKEFGLTIGWCEDLKSYKKLIPTLIEHPKDIIITCDDDIYYDNTLVESLYNSYLENPNEVKVRRACNAYIKDNIICCSKFSLEKNLNNEKICLKSRLKNQLMSGSGCLFPPHSLHPDVLNVETFKTLIPTHDDIYFWAMAVLNNTPIRIVEGFKKQMINIDNTQSSSLAKSNRKGGTGLEPREAFIRIGNEYPELIKILGGEK